MLSSTAITTSEAGTSASFTVNLNSQPSAPTTVQISAIPAIADGGALVTVRGWDEPAERGIRVVPVLVVTALTDTVKLERLRDQAQAGVLTPRVAQVLPASQAAEAHRILEKGGVRGRLVLDFTAL